MTNNDSKTLLTAVFRTDEYIEFSKILLKQILYSKGNIRSCLEKELMALISSTKLQYNVGKSHLSMMLDTNFYVKNTDIGFKNWYIGNTSVLDLSNYDKGLVIYHWLRYIEETNTGYLCIIGENLNDNYQSDYGKKIFAFDQTLIKPIYIKREIVDED